MSVRIPGAGPLPRGVTTPTTRSGPLRTGPGFAASLDRLLDGPHPDLVVEGAEIGHARPVVLSRHAEARVASRGIPFGPDEREELRDALNTLDGRGAQKALVLTGQQAWIVGVPKRTVITVMSREEALGQVFTDLDATYIAG